MSVPAPVFAIHQSPIAGDGPFACVARAWRAHELELRRFLVRQLHDPHAADDVLQDVFIKAMRAGDGFCTLDQPRAWLFEVARNAMVDHLRRLHITESVDEQLPADVPPPPTPLDLLADCIARQLPALDAADQDVLRVCDLEGKRQQAYADANGLTLAATKARLRRARQRLREQLVAACGVRFDSAGSVCCVTSS